MFRRLAAPSLICLLFLHATVLSAADWPMWGFDARRSDASPQKLPTQLHPQWVRELPPLAPAWADQPKMQFGAAYEPIVLGKTLYLPSSRWDCLLALDTETGQEKWQFFTDGPIRFAPAAWEGRLYLASDDGYLYCLDAAKGELLWKFRGGPSDRKILGNERLISTWPARGAPVISDGKVYFAASIWPFMGIFIHALDARSGKVLWTNDGDGATFMKQPHNADAFAGVAPQGPLVAIGDKLLIPGGRSVPALYDRETGKMLRYQLAENGKRGGGYAVSALDRYFFNGGAAFDLTTEKYLGELGKPLAFTDEVIFAYTGGACKAFDVKTAAVQEVDTIDKKGKKVKATRWAMKEIASLKVPGVEALILAGDRIYLAAEDKIFGLDLNRQAGRLKIVWQAEVPGKVARLIAADDRLFAVTYEGRIHCFAGSAPQKVMRHPELVLKVETQDGWSTTLQKLLDTTGIRDGYCIAWGIGSGNLVSELARQTKFHVIVVDPDEKKVDALRRKMVAERLYGTRIVAHVGDPHSFAFPPYLASLMVCEDPLSVGRIGNPSHFEVNHAFMERTYTFLRPYGGTACFLYPHGRKLAAQTINSKLVNADVKLTNELTLVVRQGPLPGAANWTHEHADAANTRVSKDQIVKAPLGLLWFGGPSHDAVLPRHGHGPQPQVIDGRMIIEGVDILRAIDIYTGRLLWEASLPGLGSFYNNTAHQPGANSSGGNYVSTADGIYVAYGKVCAKLDPATGKKLAEFSLPRFADIKDAPRWGYINVFENYLVAGADPLLDPKLLPPPPKDLGSGDDPDPSKLDPLLKLVKGIKYFSDNLSASKHLVIMDRHSGKVLWTVSAKHGFRHNGTCIGGDRLYTIDRLSGDQLAKLKRRGEEPASPTRLCAFDLKTGKEIWAADKDVFGTWLSYSVKHDVLVEAGRVARDSVPDEPKGMRTYQAADGKVLWFDKTFLGPAMIHGNSILQGQGACDLLSGAVKMRPDPLTGEEVPWKWTRTYGCNTPAASEHLLTFRSGAAGYFDLCSDSGTGNLGGFRSSCTNNLIVAGGLLTVPDYTRTCTCSYQNQSSVGLIHMPEAELWTFVGSKDVKGKIKRLGLNFGAPGDRKAENGTLWLEYPSVGGVSPVVEVTSQPKEVTYFRRFPTTVAGPMTWVTSSGVKGMTELGISLEGAGKYTVRLYFVEPDAMQPGQRVFSVQLQGKEVLRDLDIVKETGGSNRGLIKEFTGIAVDEELTIRLTATAGETILCGVEILAE